MYAFSIRTAVRTLIVSAIGASQVGCLPPAQFRSQDEFDQAVRAWVPLGTSSDAAASIMLRHSFETEWPDVAPPQRFGCADAILVCWQHTEGGFMSYRTW